MTMCLPGSARAAEKTMRTEKIEMGQMLVEAGELTVGSAWFSASMMNMMLMLGVEQMLMVKRYQRNALRRISSASGRWMIVIRPRWLKDMEMWTKVKLPPQMVGC
jgi:hypothetical protein